MFLLYLLVMNSSYNQGNSDKLKHHCWEKVERREGKGKKKDGGKKGGEVRRGRVGRGRNGFH